jgi:lantibiotic biosynthesis protein
MQLIAEKQLHRIHNILKCRTSKNDAFLGGQLGLVFYYYHLYKVTEDKEYGDSAKEMLRQIFNNLNSGAHRLAGSAFSSGGAGLGYVVNYMSAEGFIPFDIEDKFCELDRQLFNSALSQIKEDYIDFLHGALGVIHYFASRKSTILNNYYLDTLIYKLCERVISSEAGCWFRNYVLKIEEKQEINFSLSHGLSGILLILENACSKSDHKELIKKVISEGIRFLLRHKMDIDYSNDEYSFFPFIVNQNTDEISAPNQMAWCYGDLNEVLLFYRAGKLLNDPQLTRLADLIGTQSLMRKDERSTMIVDSQFCHGSSGVAHFYKKLYKESNLPLYLDGYEYWIEQTILLLDKELESSFYSGRELDMLEGLIGVAFSLLSYVSEKELNWSKSLLL